MYYAKIPDNTNDWQSMDIFLFSNGQQYSPPRKYHLRTEEIHRWKATLNFLAKSQYGSMHSAIDLYTIDGQKVEGPMQLSNGAAYVAVEPPDTFIDSGYDKYLIKASRSWEKRQARNSSTIAIIKPGDIKNQHSQTEINIDVEKTKSPDEIATLKTIVPSNFEDQVSTIIKPQLLSVVQQNDRKGTISSMKQIERKRPSNCQRTAILKKVNQIPTMSPPTSRKPSIKRKDSPPKRIIKVPGKANERTSLVSELCKNTVTEKSIISKTKETKPLGGELSKVEETSNEITSSLTKVTTSNPKSLLTDSAQVDNIIENKEIVMVSNLFRNRNSEIPSIVVDAEGKPTGLPSALCESEKAESIGAKLYEPVHIEYPMTANQAIERQNIPDNNSTNKMKLIDATKSSQPSRNNIVVINKPADDQYVAIVNNGDIVNLKLKIEITNGDDIITTRNKTIRKTHSFLSIIKTEKGSQANIEDEVFLQSKSLQSILANEYAQRNEGTPKVMVVQCTCCDQYNGIPRIDSIPICNDNKKYVIIVPSLRNEHPLRCKCDQELYQTAEKEVQKCDSIKRTSTMNSIKKTISEISLERLTKTNKAQDITEFVITRRDIAIPVSTVSSDASQIVQYERNEYVVTKRVAIDESQNTKPEYLITKSDPSQISDEPQKTEFIVIRKNTRKTLAKDFTESSTQTEWCSILLEARRHDDGRYSFHLPPLHVLRYYRL